MSGASPEIAAFGSGRLPVDAIVVWDATGGWHAATVLYRSGGGPVRVHPNWSETLSWVLKPWEYFSERLRDGQGGNGYDYDVWGFAVADPAHIEPIVNAWEADVVAATYGPMGEPIVTDLRFTGKHGSTGQGSDRVGEGDEVEERNQPSVVVDRVAAPGWLTDGRAPMASLDAFHTLTSDQADWGFSIPWLFRVLASPRTMEPMPERPLRTGPDPGVLGYWNALMHMLLYSLGWARPDRGLRWWYDHGQPTDDPRLALLAHVWAADGLLGEFAEWLARSHWALPIGALAQLTGYRDDGRAVETHPAWRRGEHFRGGSDPHHLSTHCEGPLQEPPVGGTLLRSNPAERRGVLILDSMVGWYSALVRHGATLPPLDGRSWHVDVVVKPAGWLGTYRRSRNTGLWFAGRHRYHSPGT